MKREIGSVFVTKLTKVEGTKNARYRNSAYEELSVAKNNEVLRANNHVGQYALVRVTEFQPAILDEAGDPLLDDNGKVVYSDQKIVRNQIEEVGSYEHIAKLAYADDMLEAMKADFIKDSIEEMRVERKARKAAPAVATGAVIKENQETAQTEPVIGG